MNAERALALEQRYNGFPDDLSYDDFLGLDETERQRIIANNRVVCGDTYNRSMNHAKGEHWDTPETYVLQMRRARRGFHIVTGLRKELRRLFSLPITENEVNFAQDFFRDHANLKYFNETMWRDHVLQKNEGKMDLSVHAVEEGTATLPGDPLVRVHGPGELAAHIEPYIHRIYYESLIATDAHVIEEKIGAHRFTEFGLRGVPSDEDHFHATRGMYIGGGISGTSSDASVAVYPTTHRDKGTTGHRLLQHYKTVEDAFRRIIQKMPACALLVDLIDSIQGIDLVGRLKQEYRSLGKAIGVRLDSGDIEGQLKYALQKFDELGFTDPKQDHIVVEDLSTLDQMVEIDERVTIEQENHREFDSYGAGSLLTTHNKSRSDASTGYKLTAVWHDGKVSPKQKFSNDPPKQSLPGNPTLAYSPDAPHKRIRAQVGEYPDREDLLKLAYSIDTGILMPGDLKVIRARVNTSFEQIRDLLAHHSVTPRSPLTLQFERELRAHYGLPEGHLYPHEQA